MDPECPGFSGLGGSHSPASDGRREHPVPDDSGDVLADDTSKVPTSPLEMGRGQMVSRGRRASVPYRGMRPAGVARPALQETLVGVLDVRKKAAARPLAAEAAAFSPVLGPRTGVIAGTVDLSSRTGSIGPVEVAEISIPVVAGVRFSAVAEVHSSADDVDDDTSVVRASGQRSMDCVIPRTTPGMENETMMRRSVPEPLGHSVLVVDLDGRPMEGAPVLEPIEHLVPEKPLDGGPMGGGASSGTDRAFGCGKAPARWTHGGGTSSGTDRAFSSGKAPGRWTSEGDVCCGTVRAFGSVDSPEWWTVPVLEPTEHSVLEKPLDGGPMEGMLDSEPLEHSVMDVDLDRRPMEGMLVQEPLEHSVLDVTSDRESGVGLSGLEPLEHSVPVLAMIESADTFVRTAVSDPLVATTGTV